MTPKLCDPSLIRLGDYVEAHGEKLLVTHIEKNDALNIYDFYCQNELGRPEIVVAQEQVKILL